jgi:uncharacterized protein YoxC
MAIKTKKISDLSTISATDSVILGMNGATTGKIPYSVIMDDVDGKIKTALQEFQNTLPDTNSVATIAEPVVSEEDITIMRNKIEGVREEVGSLSKSIKKSDEKFDTFYSRYTKTIEDMRASIDTCAAPTNSCDCAEMIAALTERVVALEGFVKALQAEGYLTLANIKKAAADACPIETSAE